MLLHDSRNDDGIKSFFQEVHELYIKTLLNPLYLPGSRITSSHFDTKVRALARNKGRCTIVYSIVYSVISRRPCLEGHMLTKAVPLVVLQFLMLTDLVLDGLLFDFKWHRMIVSTLWASILLL
ncbi:trafficking protein particle complex subunit [Trifolium repens]|nr:trafficking protein particle complex subunit [Trifolium repens]